MTDKLTEEQVRKEHRIEQLKVKITEFKAMQALHEETLRKLTGGSK
jgi:hypothetical protein